VLNKIDSYSWLPSAVNQTILFFLEMLVLLLLSMLVYYSRLVDIALTMRLELWKYSRWYLHVYLTSISFFYSFPKKGKQRPRLYIN
jgi:hypothetical protein